MSITMEQNESSRVVCLEGAVSIALAAELKAMLAEALEARQPLSIHLDQATGLDVCIVQLLAAVVREWKQVGVAFAFIGPLREEVSAALMDAGFEALPITLPVMRDAGVLSEV
jgi:anti-anti-sigma regulatory factor